MRWILVPLILMPSLSFAQGAVLTSAVYKEYLDECETYESHRLAPYRNLVQKVAIVRDVTDSQDPNVMPDGRKSFLQIAKEEGIDDATVEQVLDTTGVVYCPNADPAKYVQWSATIVKGNYGMLIPKHACDAVLNAQGASGLQGCTFRNYAPKFKESLVDFGTPLPCDGNSVAENDDFIAVRLKSPILDKHGKKVKPLLIAQSGDGNSMIPDPQKIINVSGGQVGMINKVPLSEPVGQICQGQPISPASSSHPSLVKNSCDSGIYGSGGIDLIWTGTGANRQLAIAAMTVSSNNHSQDGVAYGDGNNAHSIGFDGAALEALKNLKNQ